MAMQAKEFIADRAPPVTATLEQPLVTIVRRMLDNDFSQIPVVDRQNHPIGIITSDSIRKALFNFPLTLHELPIRYAMLRDPQIIGHQVDLIDLFDNMHAGYLLIVDERQELVGIVTNYDTNEYFRQRAQDIYLVENIESILKDYVLLAFDAIDDGENRLDEAIQSMTNSSVALRQKFENALRHYLSLSADSGTPRRVISHHVATVFDQHLDVERPPTQFDDLTLSNYIDLFLYREHWNQLQSVFDLEKSAVTHLLKSVLNTRNDLAHFRDITRAQSAQLRDCYNFLVEHEEAIQRAFAVQDTSEDTSNATHETEEEFTPPISSTQENANRESEVIQESPPSSVEDEPEPGESKYAPLAIWLENQPIDKALLKPSFEKIERIIGDKLPSSAYTRREWWANDSVGHVQSRQWLDVGWRVASVNMTERVVRFARIKERQKAYIDFFSKLINRLNQEPGFEEKHPLPDGSNWFFVKSVRVQDRTIAYFNFSFSRQSKFRVELYIDTNEQALNKRLFDALSQRRREIESALGHELLWQRLNSKRASRVAWTTRGHVTDDETQLDRLQEKVASIAVHFFQVMEANLQEVGRHVMEQDSTVN